MRFKITNFAKTREMREILKVVKKAFSEGQFRKKKICENESLVKCRGLKIVKFLKIQKLKV